MAFEKNGEIVNVLARPEKFLLFRKIKEKSSEVREIAKTFSPWPGAGRVRG